MDKWLFAVLSQMLCNGGTLYYRPSIARVHWHHTMQQRHVTALLHMMRAGTR